MELESVVVKFSSMFQAWHALPNLHVHSTISGECAEVVLGNNFFRDDGKGNFHIIVPVHRCVVIYFWMSSVRKGASGVNTVMLIKHLVVVRPAKDVVVTPGKSSLYPLTVTRTLCVSVLWDRILATSCK